MTYEPLRQPFIIRLAHGHRRIIAIERDEEMTFLVTDQNGRVGYPFFMSMLRTGEATFEIETTAAEQGQLYSAGCAL